MDIYEYSFTRASSRPEEAEGYIKHAEKRIAELKKNISLLRGAKVPILYDRLNILFFSRGYQRAERIGIAKIEKRGSECDTPGYGPAGSMREDALIFIPQFYFDLKKGKNSMPVFLQHESFFSDLEKMAFLRIEKDMSGTQLMKEPTKIWGDVTDISSFFSEKGVPEHLAGKIKQKYNELRNVEKILS